MMMNVCMMRYDDEMMMMMRYVVCNTHKKVYICVYVYVLSIVKLLNSLTYTQTYTYQSERDKLSKSEVKDDEDIDDEEDDDVVVDDAVVSNSGHESSTKKGKGKTIGRKMLHMMGSILRKSATEKVKYLKKERVIFLFRKKRLRIKQTVINRISCPLNQSPRWIYFISFLQGSGQKIRSNVIPSESSQS